MTSMTKRERVLRTVQFEETDRVPLYDIVQNDAIIEHYSGMKLTGEEDARVTGLAIGRCLDMTRMAGGPGKPGVQTRPDGIVVRNERYTSWIEQRPFHDVPTLAAWVKERIRELNATGYTREHAESLFQYIEERWSVFAEADPTGRQDPTVLVIESGVGLEGMWWYAEIELFTWLLVEQEDLVIEWLDAIHRAELRRVAVIADPRYIPVALTYTDIAHKTGTMLSPDWLRTHWCPRLKMLNDAWHDHGVTCLFHSDGNLWTMMDDLVAAGIDGLNPIEVLAGMTVKEVRERYPQLFLAGGIDVSQLLAFGTPAEVRAVCEQAIRDTAGRGFFMGSTTELHWQVPLENAVAMFDTAFAMAPGS